MDTFYRVKSKDEFISFACNSIYVSALKNVKEKNNFSLVLSGGSTPKEIFKSLGSEYRDKMPWTKTHLFWLDDRCVGPDHIDSNYKMAADFLLNAIPDKPLSVNRIMGELNPKEAAMRYDDQLKKYLAENLSLDFVLLGLGTDGHVASIFNLEDSKELAFPTESKHNGHFRVSMSMDLINRIENKLLLVNNPQKMNILESNLELYPINHVKNKTNLILEE